MSVPPYPLYRDSGVPWMGQVPRHWTITPLKHMASFAGGGTPSREVPAYWNGDIPWVSPKDMKAEVIRNSEERITAAGLDAGAASLIEPNAVLVVVRSGILRHTIPVAINERPVALNQDMKAIRLDVDRCHPRFMLRLVQGMNDLFLNLWLKQGATVESIEHEYLARTDIPVPPLSEQVGIVDFLDRECGKIDVLVAEQERLIALLKEKRQAVISQAVTKGLDPDAPMKASGIEWLGQVPAHWGVRKLRAIARLETGHTPSRQHPEYWVESECVIPWFTLADVSFLRDEANIAITQTSQRISEIGMENSAARLLPAKTVILSRTASVGFSGIMEMPMAVSQDFAAWVCGPRLVPEYLLLCLRAMKGEFQRLMMGSTHQTIYMPDIEAFRVPIPPLPQQSEIVAFVTRKTQSVDALTDEAERAIALLKERRAALISAAVTGKIDVRGLVAPAAAEAA